MCVVRMISADSPHVSPPAAAIGVVSLMTRFSLARLMSCSSFEVNLV